MTDPQDLGHGPPSELLESHADGARPGGVRLDRLPPPVFPPGHRRSWVHRPRPGAAAGGGEGGEAGQIPPDAFSAPDAPIRRVEDPAEAAADARAEGMGSEWERGGPYAALSRDDVADLLMELAREVRAHRSGRLLWKPAAPPLEGAIRGLLSGFLRDPE